MTQSTVLITGATGFSGKYHIEKAIAEGFQVVGIGRNAEKLLLLEETYPGFTGRVCDLTALDSEIDTILQEFKPKFVIHLAAKVYQGEHKTPAMTLRNNGLCTLSILEAVRLYANQARVLITTSAALYGGPANKKDENAPVRSKDAYSASKMYDRILGHAYHQQFGLDIVEAVVYNHNGPGRVSGIHPTIAKTMVQAKLDGMNAVDIQIPSLQYARDMQQAVNWADASFAILQNGVTGEAYNICYGEDLTLEAFIDELAKQTGVTPNIIVDPAITRYGPNAVSGGDNSKLRMLGWEPALHLSDLVQSMIAFWTEELS